MIYAYARVNEELIAEKDYIFTWACKGLQRLIKNNYKFTECSASNTCKEKYWSIQCPEQSFVNYHLEFTDDKVYESSKKIKETFEAYCQKHNVDVAPSTICNYLESSYGIIKQGSKKRIDENGHICSTGNPIFVPMFHIICKKFLQNITICVYTINTFLLLVGTLEQTFKLNEGEQVDVLCCCGYKRCRNIQGLFQTV